MFNVPNNMIGHPERVCHVNHTHGSTESLDCFCLLPGHCGVNTFFPFVVMRLVLKVLEILKIIREVVEFIFVFVMYVMPIRARANEGQGDKFMYVILAPLVVLEEPKVVIAILQTKRFIPTAMRHRPTALRAYPCLESFDFTVVADLIQTFVARDIAPFFKGELGLNRFWGMLAHVDSASNAIDLIRGRVTSTLPGLFACSTPVSIAQKVYSSQ